MTKNLSISGATRSEHGPHFVRSEWWFAQMNYRMTVRAEGDQIRRRINLMSMADGAERLEMMNVDEAVGDFTVGRREFESTNRTRRSALCDTHRPKHRVPFIPRQFNERMTALDPDFRHGRIEKFQLFSERGLAMKAYFGRIGVQKYRAEERQTAVPVVEAAMFVKHALGRFTTLARKWVHFRFCISPWRRVHHDAVCAVDAVCASLAVGVRFAFQRRCQELRIGRDVNRERLSASPRATLNHYHLIVSHSGHCTPCAFAGPVRGTA